LNSLPLKPSTCNTHAPKYEVHRGEGQPANLHEDGDAYDDEYNKLEVEKTLIVNGRFARSARGQLQFEEDREVEKH